jgi:hypothetical protein
MPDFEIQEWTHVSPSQIMAFRRCALRWWWQTIAGFRSPETASQKLGKAIHAELEAYLKNGEMPTNRIALSGITRLPNPEDVDELDVEFGFELQVDGMPVPVIGFIDLKEPAAHRVSDHKTTSNFQYAKSADELEGDPQSIIYCTVGAEPEIVGNPKPWGTDKVVFPVAPTWRGPIKFRHIYYRTQGGAISTEREVQYRTKEQLQRQMDGLVRVTQRMAHAAMQDNPATVDVNLSACDDYGGCPHRARCAALGHEVFGAMSGLYRPKTMRATMGRETTEGTTMQGNEQKKSPLALLKSKGAGNSEANVAAALNRLQTTTPEQYADGIAKVEAEVRVCQAFASGAGRTNAELLPGDAVAGLVARGLFKLDGKVLTPTDLGGKVVGVLLARGVVANQAAPVTPANAPASPATPPAKAGGLLGRLKSGGAVPAAPAAPTKPTDLQRIHALSPKLTAAWNATDADPADVAEGVLEEIAAILEIDSPDGSIDAKNREIYEGMVGDAIAEIERRRTPPPPPEAPKGADSESAEDTDDIPVITIEIETLESLFIENEDKTGPKVGDWWREKFGVTIEDATAVGQMALDDGDAYKMDNGLVLMITDEISGVLCPSELLERFTATAGTPVQGAGSAINPPDGVKSDTPDAELPPDPKNKGGRPVLGPVLPDGTNVRKLGKKELVDAHKALFGELEGSPAVKVYRGASKLPEKRPVVEDYYADIELMLALLKANADGTDPAAAVQGLQDAASAAEAAEAATGGDNPPETPAAAPRSVTPVTPARTVTPVALKTPEPPTGGDTAVQGFRLFIGCRPVRGGQDVVELADFLRPFEEAVAAEDQIAHVMDKPFKDGIKATVVKLQIAYNRSELALPPAIYVPRDHPGAGEAAAFLTRFAFEIVRVCY